MMTMASRMRKLNLLYCCLASAAVVRKGFAFVPGAHVVQAGCSARTGDQHHPRCFSPHSRRRSYPTPALLQSSDQGAFTTSTAAHAAASLRFPSSRRGTLTNRRRFSSRNPRTATMMVTGAVDPGSLLTVASSTVSAAVTAVTTFTAEAGGDVSAWSVTSLTSDLAAELFQASLFPYLAFLFFLSRKESKTPKGGLFGFAFLLVFVVATIPAGIYAKTEYNEILANVDYLHGIAESFLTITNLLIVAAFRKAIMTREQAVDDSGAGQTVLRSSTAAATIAAFAAAPLVLAATHAEPTNALSFPTWMVHVSSLIEWLAAMTYVWRFADVSGLKEWKGLTWGMLPLHTSGLIACTYHIFYNSPELTSLVAMQAGLTCFGNSTMAFAMWRVWQAGKEEWEGDDEEDLTATMPAPPATGDGESLSSFSEDLPFYGQILGITVAGAALVKWGELLVDFPFEPSYAAAALLILGPTALNAKKWSDRSADPSAPIDSII